MVAMLCRLYGEPYATHFPLSCMPLIYLCAHVGVSFNWADIFSENIKDVISAVTQAQPGSFPSFHMSSYLLDIMCITHKYPNMGWSWFPVDVVIHIYCKVLWEHKYQTNYQRIYEHFLAPLYEFIFCTSPPCMTDKAIIVIRRIGDWYLMEHGTYIRIYSAMKPPNLLPRLVPDKLVLQEVAYQTIIHGVGGILYRSKKSIWPPLPLYIGNYFFENTKQAQGRSRHLAFLPFWRGKIQEAQPQNIVKYHFHRLRLSYEYTTKFWEEE
jgi:hypothetical protein